MIKNFVKILELLGDRLEVCVSVYNFKGFMYKRYNHTIIQYIDVIAFG